jgi:hypothetical protein
VDLEKAALKDALNLSAHEERQNLVSNHVQEREALIVAKKVCTCVSELCKRLELIERA